ncbi:MAG: hypothetical protein L6R41_005161 [Letrouitia leprolyta]|nr:MAG: hypothetical protein L6R41_005161 [Letrouitia leprolyta]
MASTYTANGDNGDSGSTEGELNEWKHRAPYRVHDKQEHFQARYEGSCHCGKVKYQLSRAPFQWAAIFHKDDINFTEGVHDLGCPEERKNFEISCHMFYPRRVLDIPDGKPKWTGINGQSDLIEDTPQEAINELKRKRQEEEENKDGEKS